MMRWAELMALGVLALGTHAAMAQQTGADRIGIVWQEGPTIVEGGALAIMAAACGLGPRSYGAEGAPAQMALIGLGAIGWSRRRRA